GALGLGDLGDPVRQRLGRQHAGDEQALALEQHGRGVYHRSRAASPRNRLAPRGVVSPGPPRVLALEALAISCPCPSLHSPRSSSPLPPPRPPPPARPRRSRPLRSRHCSTGADRTRRTSTGWARGWGPTARCSFVMRSAAGWCSSTSGPRAAWT